jgi:hypothetical protein
MTKKMISYANKTVYVGIDVHKETYVVACICEGQIVKTASCKAVPVGSSLSFAGNSSWRRSHFYHRSLMPRLKSLVQLLA